MSADVFLTCLLAQTFYGQKLLLFEPIKCFVPHRYVYKSIYRVVSTSIEHTVMYFCSQSVISACQDQLTN